MAIYAVWGGVLLATVLVAAVALAGDYEVTRLKNFERLASLLLVFTVALAIGILIK